MSTDRGRCAPPAQHRSRRLRIAYAMINCNRREGSSRPVNEVAERLGKKHEVHLFARSAEEIDLTNICWHRMPGPAWPDVLEFSVYHYLARGMITRRRFDIIHSIGNNAFAANVITIQNIQPAKRKLLQTLPERPVSLARRVTRNLFLEVTTHAERTVYQRRKPPPPLFLPVSRGVEGELRSYYNIGSAPVRIIPNAADLNQFKPLDAPAREGWRREQGFSPDDVVLVFAGGEWARKGLDVAITTLAHCPNPAVKLFVAGRDAEIRGFAALAQQAGVRARVTFGGFRRDLPRALGACDIFFLPSRYEAFSLAVLEAAATGLPVVATRISGTEDFIVPGENGFFVTDKAATNAAVLRPLVESPALRRAMGQAGRRLVENEYTWDRVAELTEQAYFDYLEGYSWAG